MPSPIDQRLAALHHLRQIEATVRLERLANHTARVYADAGRRVVALTLDGGTPSRLRRSAVAVFRQAFRDVGAKMVADYATLADWSYTSAADSLIEAIPRNWFRLASPVLAHFEAVESRRIDATENESLIAFVRQIFDGIVFDSFTEPIAQGFIKDLSKAQWSEVVKGVVFKPPTEARTTELINAPDELGKTWRERLAVLSKKVTDVDRVAAEMAAGFADGETPSQLRKRVKPLVSNITSSTKRIVRTEGLRIAERIQRESWDALGDMMIGAQILAVLDQNTRQHHALRNGRIYYKKPFLLLPDQFRLEDIPLLPDEPNCRCWSTPVLRPPKDFENDPVLNAAFRNEDGAGIPDPATYDEWFARVDVGRRRLAVGTKRYNAVASELDREPEWSDFIEPENGALVGVTDFENESTLERIIRKGKVAKLIAERKKRIQDIANVGFTL